MRNHRPTLSPKSGSGYGPTCKPPSCGSAHWSGMRVRMTRLQLRESTDQPVSWGSQSGCRPTGCHVFLFLFEASWFIGMPRITNHKKWSMIGVAPPIHARGELPSCLTCRTYSYWRPANFRTPCPCVGGKTQQRSKCIVSDLKNQIEGGSRPRNGFESSSVTNFSGYTYPRKPFRSLRRHRGTQGRVIPAHTPYEGLPTKVK